MTATTTATTTATRATDKGHGRPQTGLYFGRHTTTPTKTGRAVAVIRIGTSVAFVDAVTGERVDGVGVAGKFWFAAAPATTEPADDEHPWAEFGRAWNDAVAADPVLAAAVAPATTEPEPESRRMAATRARAAGAKRAAAARRAAAVLPAQNAAPAPTDPKPENAPETGAQCHVRGCERPATTTRNILPGRAYGVCATHSR